MDLIKQDKNVFKSIFKDHWQTFKRRRPNYALDQYEKAVGKMLGCGEESKGYCDYLCTHCGHDFRRVCFTCKSCFCLSCSRFYVDKVVHEVSKSLHEGLVYRHVVLTIPEQFRDYFYKNRFNGDLLSLFMRTGHQCLESMQSNIFKRAIKTGSIVVVQTHGRSGSYNPHLHIIMSSGGLDIENEKWKNLQFFKYDLIHKKWQYYLSEMMRVFFDTEEMKKLVKELYRKYPKGFVANVSKGKAPQSCKGLARYLAKYVASPPIALRRVLNYDGNSVTYYYKDHETKGNVTETVPAFIFIGRMVEHILPKGFQRIRYYGLQATRSFKKWKEVILSEVKKLEGLLQEAYQIVGLKSYRKRYEEVSGKDPFICQYCGSEMEKWYQWHPDYGVLYDGLKGMMSVSPKTVKEEFTIISEPPGIQLPLPGF